MAPRRMLQIRPDWCAMKLGRRQDFDRGPAVLLPPLNGSNRRAHTAYVDDCRLHRIALGGMLGTMWGNVALGIGHRHCTTYRHPPLAFSAG